MLLVSSLKVKQWYCFDYWVVVCGHVLICAFLTISLLNNRTDNWMYVYNQFTSEFNTSMLTPQPIIEKKTKIKKTKTQFER